MIRNRCFISFGVTEEEKAVIEAYCQKKKRWKTSSDLARDALWQLMARYPIYQKRAQKGVQAETTSAFPEKGATPVSGTA